MNWLKRVWKALRGPVQHTAPLTQETMCNFTPRAQQVLALARKEADRYNHNFVGTEHLLLGLTRLGQGVAVNVLGEAGVTLETVRAEVEKQIGTGLEQKTIGNIPYTPRVKKVLALAAKEAKMLNHTYVGTEHILLGLLREGDNVAARVLNNLGVKVETLRTGILKELDPNYSAFEARIEFSDTKEQSPNLPERQARPVASAASATADLMDLTKRYDVYCSERNREVVVYRSVLFKGLRRLFQEDRDTLAEFYELKQVDGQQVFVPKYSVVKFCESGVTPGSETVPGQKV